MPAAFETVFSSTSLDEGNVSYAIKLDNETTVHAWSGLLSDEAPVWTGELDPGTYTIETIVDEGIVVEQQLELKPLAAVQTVGHVVLTALLVLLAWGEQGVRALLARRAASQPTQQKEKAPFKPAGYSQEENPLSWDASDSPWREPLR